MEEQARKRRQKRERILQGGPARLDRITSLSGRTAASEKPAPDQESYRSALGGIAPNDSPNNHPFAPVPTTQKGGEKVNYEPRNDGSGAAVTSAEDQAGLGSSVMSPMHLPALPTEQSRSAQDAGLQLLQQMIGTSTMSESSPGFAGLPPALESLLSQPRTSPEGETTSQPQTLPSTYSWKILHPLLALSLGVFALVYVAPGDAFFQRTARQPGDQAQTNLFWIFATVELLLQTTRYLLEPTPDRSGMLATAAGFLPPPWKGYVELVVRYQGIWSTLSSDALVLIWSLGMGAWWHLA